MERKQCYLCERTTDDWQVLDEDMFDDEEIEERIIERYFIHCVGNKEMFVEDGGVVLCKDCVEIITKGFEVHICYVCRRPTMDFGVVDIPEGMSVMSVPGKCVTSAYKLVVCYTCVKILNQLLRR